MIDAFWIYIPGRGCGKTIAREILRQKMIQKFFEYDFLTCMPKKKYSYRFITPLFVWSKGKDKNADR